MMHASRNPHYIAYSVQGAGLVYATWQSRAGEERDQVCVVFRDVEFARPGIFSRVLRSTNELVYSENLWHWYYRQVQGMR
jgi:hypothetical protein